MTFTHYRHVGGTVHAAITGQRRTLCGQVIGYHRETEDAVSCGRCKKRAR